MIRLASKDFIPVSGDDWYQRRRNDAEGEFFRKVAGQGPRKGKGGSTRQGIYCFTASGKLLAYKNAQDAGVMLETIKQGLKRFKALPEDERKPGAVEVGDAGKVDARYARTPPEGGLILRAYTRILDRDGKSYVKGECAFTGGDKAARDHVWLKKDEWQSLIPADPKKGDVFAMPTALARRLCRFHLVDNTRGEPSYWLSQEVRKAHLKWTVKSVNDGEMTLELAGSALLATEADAEKAKRGYDVALRGMLRYDRSKKAITQLEIVALGDHWGRSTFTPGDRPGRKPLGVAFELVTGDKPDQRIPPQAGREIAAYYAAK
jgi:hypothetical protein